MAPTPCPLPDMACRPGRGRVVWKREKLRTGDPLIVTQNFNILFPTEEKFH